MEIAINLERSDQHFLGCVYSFIEIVSFINHEPPTNVTKHRLWRGWEIWDFTR